MTEVSSQPGSPQDTDVTMQGSSSPAIFKVNPVLLNDLAGTRQFIETTMNDWEEASVATQDLSLSLFRDAAGIDYDDTSRDMKRVMTRGEIQDPLIATINWGSICLVRGIDEAEIAKEALVPTASHKQATALRDQLLNWMQSEANAKREFVIKSEIVTEAVREFASQGPAQRFEILKFVALHEQLEDTSDSASAALFTEMLVYRGTDFLQTIRDELGRGGFAPNVAMDVMQAASSSSGTEVASGLGRIVETMNFATALLTRAETERHVDGRQLSVPSRIVLQQWISTLLHDVPSSDRAVFDAEGRRLADIYDRALIITKKNVDTQTGDKESEPMKVFLESFARYRHLLLHRAPSRVKAGAFAPASAVGQDPRRKRALLEQSPHLKPRHPAVHVAPSQSETEAKAEVEPWDTALIVKGNGHFKVVDDPDALSSIRADYRDYYPRERVGSPMDLLIGLILSQMPAFDFSKGTVPGVVRSSGGDIRIGEAEQDVVPLFEYKPNGLGELDRSTPLAKRARKLRVLFAMLPEHRLGLIKVLERDDIQEWGRNNGLFAGSPRRNK